MEDRAVTVEAVATARRLAHRAPWDYRWRPREDGGVDVAYVSERRNLLARVHRDGSHEELARSPQQSRLSWWLQHGIFVSFLGFMVLFGSWQLGLALMAAGVLAVFVGARLDAQPALLRWLADQVGATEGWAPLPRTLPSMPPTGSQLIALCAVAAEHRNVVLYRLLPGPIVEAAVVREGGYDVSVVDRFGRLRPDRRVERASTARRLRKRDGGPAWEALRTDEPPSD